MSLYVADGYDERIVRLVLGFEPQDPLRGARIEKPIRMDIESGGEWQPADPDDPYAPTVRPTDQRAAVARRPSGRYAIVYHVVDPVGDYHPPLGESVDVRLYSPERQFVPRRLRIPLLTRAQAEVEGPTNPVERRVRRPALFPGASYGPTARATGLRGRVLRGGAPMRWGRVVATLGTSTAIVGRAHVDDRGEFLLLLDAAASPFEHLVDPVDVRVSVFGPGTAPTPSSPAQPAADPWWDLPLEELPATGALNNDADTVSTGEQLPAGFVTTPSSVRTVSLRLGRTLTTVDVPEFVFG